MLRFQTNHNSKQFVGVTEIITYSHIFVSFSNSSFVDMNGVFTTSYTCN